MGAQRFTGKPLQSYGASSATWDHILSPHACERAPRQLKPDKPVLDLLTSGGWKAEFSLVSALDLDGYLSISSMSCDGAAKLELIGSCTVHITALLRRM